MAHPGVSPKTSLRKSLLETYRARGKSINNLWLVYSPKTDCDWILPSDRQLVHWLYYLEANPEVKSFDLAPEQLLSHDEHEARGTELDAVAILKNGHTEWHEVKAGVAKESPEYKSQFTAQSNEASRQHATYKRFDDRELKPKVKIAMRWLKAINYATAIRGEEHKACLTALRTVIKQQGSGNLQRLLSQLQEHDSAVVFGVLVRIAITGEVSLNLDKSTFGLQTRWDYRG